MKEEQKWLRLDGDDGWQVIIPDIDSKPHSHPKGSEDAEVAWLDCPCKPRVNVGDKIIIHNSFRDIEKIDQAITIL